MNHNDPIRWCFYTCHDSWAVVTCVKQLPDWIINIRIRAKHISLRFHLWPHKQIMKYVPSAPCSMWFLINSPGGHFKNTFELLNLRALKLLIVDKIIIFQCMGQIFCGTLWNSTQNIWPIHWKIWFLYNIKILRALRFKSSYALLKCPPGDLFHWICLPVKNRRAMFFSYTCQNNQ